MSSNAILNVELEVIPILCAGGITEFLSKMNKKYDFL